MHVLAYLLPAFVNFVCAGMFLITSTRFAVGGAPSWVVGMSVGAWALIYFIGSLIAGKITTERNATRLIIIGSLMMAAAQIGFLIDKGLYSQFIWIVLTSAGDALYCVPFQLFAKALESGRPAVGVARAASFYTVSWSAGSAVAPLIFGCFSAKVAFGITFVLMLLNALITFWADRTMHRRGISLESVSEEKKTENNISSPIRNYAILGWLIGGAGTFAISQIRSMWSKLGVDLGFPLSRIAMILLIVYCAQAATALLLCNSRKWMYQVFPNLLFALLGIGGMVFFALSHVYCNFVAGALIYGIFSGGSYFLLVFHSLAHPTLAAANVTVNEILVGIVSIVAPLTGGWIAGHFNGNAPFTLAASVLAAASLLLVVLLNRFRHCER